MISDEPYDTYNSPDADKIHAGGPDTGADGRS